MTKIFINDKGWVEIQWGKLIDRQGYFETASRMITLITSIEDQGIHPLMLIDFSKLERITNEAANLASKATRDLGCKKIAGFGIKPEFAAILDSIKEASTKADTIREFKTRKEAEAWLDEKNSPIES